MVTVRQMAAGLTLLGDFVLSLCSIGGDETLEIQATLPSEYPRKAKVGYFTESRLSGCWETSGNGRSLLANSGDVRLLRV